MKKIFLILIPILFIMMLIGCGDTTSLDELQVQYSQKATEVDQLNNELIAKATEIEALKAEVDQKTERISELEGQVDEQAEKISELESTITSIQEAVKEEEIVATPEPEPETPTYQLQLLAMNDEREYGYITVQGLVKNISNVNLENVEAVVNFYTADGTFVKSDSALIEYNPILPGQTSPFEVMTTENPAISKYSTTFKHFWGSTIPTEDKR